MSLLQHVSWRLVTASVFALVSSTALTISGCDGDSPGPGLATTSPCQQAAEHLVDLQLTARRS